MAFSIDRLLTITQLAEKLFVKEKTVRSWIYKRTIPFTRVGRRIYFDAGVVEELLNRNAIGGSGLRSPGSKPAGQGGATERKPTNE